MAGPKNYTTSIAAKRTVNEVLDLLGEHGADAASVAYRDRQPAAVRFMLGEHTYTLPVNVDGMHDLLVLADRAGSLKGTQAERKRWITRDHAEKVAWRVIRDWLDAQLALVAADQVTLGEVMLPYLHTPAGPTLREQWTARGALGVGGA